MHRCLDFCFKSLGIPRIIDRYMMKSHLLRGLPEQQLGEELALSLAVDGQQRQLRARALGEVLLIARQVQLADVDVDRVDRGSEVRALENDGSERLARRTKVRRVAPLGVPRDVFFARQGEGGRASTRARLLL